MINAVVLTIAFLLPSGQWLPAYAESHTSFEACAVRAELAGQILASNGWEPGSFVVQCTGGTDA